MNLSHFNFIQPVFWDCFLTLVAVIVPDVRSDFEEIISRLVSNQCERWGVKVNSPCFMQKRHSTFSHS